MRRGIVAAMLIAAVGLVGCRQPEKQDVEAAIDDLSDCIETRCVAAYYKEDVPYWTDQQQRFCPTAGLFEAWGTEPEGKWNALFQDGKLSVSGLKGTAAQALPAGLMNTILAESLFYGFTAGGGFEPAALTAPQVVSLEGRRYEAFEVSGTAGRTVTLYKNIATGYFEFVRVTEAGGADWMAQSYNLRYHDRFKRAIPRKIDVFDVQRGIAAKKLMIQVEYIDVR